MLHKLSLNKLTNLSKFNFCAPIKKSTYTLKKGDLSSDMLVSLSMGHLKSENTNQVELTQNLQLNNILKNQFAVDAFQAMDRKFFDFTNEKDQNTSAQTLYNNNILKLTNKQNMTTPLMHAIALDNIGQYLEKLKLRIKSSENQKQSVNLKIVDIGSGRGYITFSILKMLNLLNLQGKVYGLDIYEQLISDSKYIKQILKQKNIIQEQEGKSEAIFELSSLQEFINQFKDQKSCHKDSIHIIHSGVALEKNQVEEIKQFLMDKNIGYFIYPEILEDGEQILQSITYNSTILEKQDIMKCMYTRIQDQQIIQQQRDQDSVKQFFIETEEDLENNDNSQEQQKSEELVQREKDELVLKKILENQQKFQLELKTRQEFIKNWTQIFKEKNNNNTPKFQDMLKDESMAKTLERIRELNRKLDILQRQKSEQVQKNTSNQ
ncbi:hypothetical protein PPERSA_10212 [Pseudocohnilembus persalinus]|uniref:protein-L-isoaspartate(D-aspartate) O-methyltransferase n=1 Tax=Pseudocohnilembus persalinus TaxID=266149 RepID=A0A0V0QLJ4_PSEPJ|nr:hypothetical protein PPERSA_10212 [Pseudocohnilembus persalinus]|eukprot:KRX03131.1 hypothetical protein PPERSA_10212 [Pseudocohnilembus persalinus]